MALIDCPECGHKVSNVAKYCPHCGYGINSNNNYFDLNKIIDYMVKKPSIFFVCIVIFMCMVISLKWDSSDKEYTNSNNSNYSSETTVNASTIFNNLTITNFSSSLGKHAGTMTCEVVNNNNFTVDGYFYVLFYDKNSNLMYSQLMSLPTVSSGEKVFCSTPIPKDSYPSGYSYVKYSQASLVKK